MDDYRVFVFVLVLFNHSHGEPLFDDGILWFYLSQKNIMVQLETTISTTSFHLSRFLFSFSHGNFHYQICHANYQALLSRRVDQKKIMIIYFENPLQINVF